MTDLGSSTRQLITGRLYGSVVAIRLLSWLRGRLDGARVPSSRAMPPPISLHLLFPVTLYTRRVPSFPVSRLSLHFASENGNLHSVMWDDPTSDFCCSTLKERRHRNIHKSLIFITFICSAFRPHNNERKLLEIICTVTVSLFVQLQQIWTVT